VALGRISAQLLLHSKAPLKALRGQVHEFQGIPLWVTYHPAALLRNMDLLPDAHQDLLTLKNMVNSGSK
jgi:uracil-DNA glycosylase